MSSCVGALRGKDTEIMEQKNSDAYQADAGAPALSEKVIRADEQRHLTQSEQAVMHRAFMRSVRLVMTNGDRTSGPSDSADCLKSDTSLKDSEA